MYRLERTDFVKPKYISLWSTLGFQAGFINAFGFLAFGRYVSHVTGFGSQIGVALANQNPWLALELLGFPLSFMFGAFLSGCFTIAKVERGRKPRYDWITLAMPLLIGAMMILGQIGVFGSFGEQLVRQRDFALLFLLSFVCGLQNGCFATLTKGQIRTTHLTGISTDIGTDFARMWFGKLTAEERKLTWMTNISRISTFSFFAFGSIVSVMCSNWLGHFALVVPFITSSVVYVTVVVMSRALDRRYSNENALSGSFALTK